MTTEGFTDKELAHVDLRYVRDMYKYPHMVGHRSSLAGSLYDGCKKEKAIKFHFSMSIAEVKQWSPKVRFVSQPRNGKPEELECDVLLASDGIKSKIREQMLKLLNHEATVVDTKQAAYRIMLTREQMKSDPDLLALIDGERVTRWIAPKKHIIAYPVSDKQIYNLSTAQPDSNFAIAPSETYTTKGEKKALLEVFAGWDDKVQKMLNLVPDGEVCEWKLRVHSPLPTWIYGDVALVGDACHPTLPHLAQGAAQAIEDGAVLGVVLSKLPDTKPESITKALKVYEQVRKERAESLVALAAQSGRTLHAGEGADQEERNKAFAALSKEKSGPVPDKWADADVQKMIYGHDCMQIAADEFDELYAKA